MPRSSKSSLNAEQVRDKVLPLLEANPEGLRSLELVDNIYPETNDADEHHRRSQHMGFVMRSLAQAKRVKKVGNRMTGRWVILGNRPAPEIHDLPRNGDAKRGRPRGSKNGEANGSAEVRAYILRDIKAKIAELEALG